MYIELAVAPVRDHLGRCARAFLRKQPGHFSRYELAVPISPRGNFILESSRNALLQYRECLGSIACAFYCSLVLHHLRSPQRPPATSFEGIFAESDGATCPA